MRIFLIRWHEVKQCRKLGKTGQPAVEDARSKAEGGTRQGPEALYFCLALPWTSSDLRKALPLARHYLCLNNDWTKA